MALSAMEASALQKAIPYLRCYNHTQLEQHFAEPFHPDHPTRLTLLSASPLYAQHIRKLVVREDLHNVIFANSWMQHLYTFTANTRLEHVELTFAPSMAEDVLQLAIFLVNCLQGSTKPMTLRLVLVAEHIFDATRELPALLSEVLQARLEQLQHALANPPRLHVELVHETCGPGWEAPSDRFTSAILAVLVTHVLRSPNPDDSLLINSVNDYAVNNPIVQVLVQSLASPLATPFHVQARVIFCGFQLPACRPASAAIFRELVYKHDAYDMSVQHGTPQWFGQVPVNGKLVAWVTGRDWDERLANLLTCGADTIVIKQVTNDALIRSLLDWLGKAAPVQATRLRCLHVECDEGSISSAELYALLSAPFDDAVDFVQHVLACFPNLVELKLSCAQFSAPYELETSDPTTTVTHSFGHELDAAVAQAALKLSMALAGTVLPAGMAAGLKKHGLEVARSDVSLPLF